MNFFSVAIEIFVTNDGFIELMLVLTLTAGTCEKIFAKKGNNKNLDQQAFTKAAFENVPYFPKYQCQQLYRV